MAKTLLLRQTRTIEIARIVRSVSKVLVDPPTKLGLYFGRILLAIKGLVAATVHDRGTMTT